MSLLNNILGNNMQQTPTNLVQNSNGNDQLMQLFMEASKVKNPKQMVKNMIENGQISKEQFEQVKGVASALGLDMKQFGRLESFFK